MYQFKEQAPGRWAVYDGTLLVDSDQTIADLFGNPVYRDAMVMNQLVLKAANDAEFATAYAILKLAMAIASLKIEL